jgi:hypothetical protein
MRAFSVEDVQKEVKLDEAAKLNTLLHIATDTSTGLARGTVITLPKPFSGSKFEQFFGSAEHPLANQEFFSKIPPEEKPQWVLVQTQAACDHAQGNAGLPPFYLGLEIDAKFYRKDGKPPASLWKSPIFSRGDSSTYVLVNARYPLTIPSKLAAKQKSRYRLRDQVLGELIFTMHTHASRPGIVSIFEKKAKKS